MKRFTFVCCVFLLFFSPRFFLFGQTPNEKEEIIEVEMNCFDFDDNIEITIEDVEIESSAPVSLISTRFHYRNIIDRRIW